ncbi:MAG: hypothetical protein H7327_15865 [Herminiimonas sp.]|nr:hypothetical protein [Herminiimonas sp.]
MGIFSLFGKKERPPTVAAGSIAAGRKKREEPQRGAAPAAESLREQQAEGQRQVARATALKIDAIESEMSSEFVRPAPQRPASATPVAANQKGKPGEPAAGTATISDTSFDAPVNNAMLEDVPLFEEAAILFANDQREMVETILRDAIDSDDLGAAALTAWAMLFDLYQINGNQADFEDLSIAYASRFETSPPAWMPVAGIGTDASATLRAVATPTVVFSGNLDATIGKTLEKVLALSDKHAVLRLEFVHNAVVDPVGCALLLRVLKQLRKAGLDLILVGAPELVIKIRAILEVGRRDETEAPWLLLMALLELLNQESAFEEASIDYCVTFEVSPPAFVAPNNKVTTAMEEPNAVVGHPDTFVMPALIEGRIDALVATLVTFVASHNPTRIDCAALARVDVNAAGQLMAGLMPLAGDGRLLEFIHVNHLVAALFNVIGLRDIVQIHTRKI